MINLKHTPGPWHHGHFVDCENNITKQMTTVYDNDNRTICDSYINGNLARGEANARLIAAAPDLLETSIRMLDMLDYLHSTNRLPQGYVDHINRGSSNMDYARAAIAKARGE